MTLVLFQLLNAFIWSWAVALMALGLNLVYGVLRVINVAHGAFYMLGAVGGWLILGQLAEISQLYALNFAVALLLAPFLVGAAGTVMERLALRPIIDRPVLTIIATFALLLIIQQGVQIFLPGAQSVSAPLPGSVPVLALRYPSYRFLLAGLSIVLMGGLGLFLHRTRWGLWTRAIRQDRELASALGIPVPRIYSLTFGAGVALAAASGVLTAPITSVEARMGNDILIDSFIVVIVGGLGSLRGAVVAALIFRLAEGLLAVWLEPIVARALALLLMGGLLLLRPHGLFGAVGAEAAPAEESGGG